MFRKCLGCVLAVAAWGAVAGVGRLSAAAAEEPQTVRISPDQPASLAQGIHEAYKAGRKKVVIPPGEYRLPPVDGAYYLRLEAMADFEIDARGVTLLRSDPRKGAIDVARCRNLTLRGATLRNETPPFTQGTIVAVDPKGLWYDVRIDKGYPANFDDPTYFPPAPTGYVFDPKTRQWKAGTNDFYCKGSERRGPALFRLHFHDPKLPERENVAVGDLMAFRGNCRTDIHIGESEGIAIEGVTILSGGGFCIHESSGDGGNRYTYKVTYGPRPAGADAPPLVACNADAFHSSGVRQGPTLENCLFEGMPDDGVPIHGTYAMAMEAEGTTLVLATVWGNFFRPGDPLRLFNKRGGYVGETTVRTVAPARGYRPKQQTEHKSFRKARNFWRLTLAEVLPAEFEFLVSDPAACGRGFVVRNNVIRHHRARGMLLKADEGLVEGNTIEGSTIAGIVLAPELWWNEACYSRNVILRNNTIRRVGYATVGPWTTQAGAITVLGEGQGDRPGHRHIFIEGNTVADCDGVNLLVTSAEDVRVRRNRFLRPQAAPTRRGADHLKGIAALVWLRDCRDVRFEGNTIVDPGAAFDKVFDVSPTARDVKGMEDGIRR